MRACDVCGGPISAIARADARRCSADCAKVHRANCVRERRVSASHARQAHLATSTDFVVVSRVASRTFGRFTGNGTIDRESFNRRRAVFVNAALRRAGWMLVDATGLEVETNGWWVRRVSSKRAHVAADRYEVAS